MGECLLWSNASGAAMIWFTGDTHFGHAAIILHCTRPFETLEEMDDTLVRNWNSVIAEKDEVWHLGDFAYGGFDRVHDYADRLNGRINVLVGNHDKKSILMRVFGDDHVFDTKYLRHEGKRFWLSHYAHRCWPSSHHGTYHLFGHSHGQMPNYGRSMDVGVDSSDATYAKRGFHPISMGKVIILLEKGDIVVHHTGMDGLMSGVTS